jgi:hypothetical protein
MDRTLTDPTAYLQRRVAMFSGVTASLFALLLVVDYANWAKDESAFSSTRVAGLLALGASLLVWALTRRGVRSQAQSRLLELSVLGVMAATYGTLPAHPPVPGTGVIMSFFAPIPMLVAVLLRAAVIPSPPWLSITVALVWGGLMTAVSVWSWEPIATFQLVPKGQVFEAWQLPFSFGVFVTGSTALVAGVISQVVHGLQSKVREAMQLGQYTLEWKIGEGGMGAVYRARHRLLRRPTAVKLLPPDKTGQETVARFEREVQQTSRLTHPNTVAIFDYGRTEDGIFYYVMEYLDGISLQELVDHHGTLPPARVIHLLVQVAESLGEAHGLGLVHRDIKPDNVLLCERGGVSDVVKVLDFGLVKQVDAPDDPGLSAADAIKGTPLYIAPESLTNPDHIDGRTDLYAVGAVGFTLLAGRPPFLGRGTVEVLGQHLHRSPPPLRTLRPEVDADLEGVIRRCLEKEPENRFDSALALVDALNGCAAAGRWTRRDAADWWATERQTIRARRERTVQPTALRLALGDGAAARSPS